MSFARPIYILHIFHQNNKRNSFISHGYYYALFILLRSYNFVFLFFFFARLSLYIVHACSSTLSLSFSVSLWIHFHVRFSQHFTPGHRRRQCVRTWYNCVYMCVSISQFHDCGNNNNCSNGHVCFGMTSFDPNILKQKTTERIFASKKILYENNNPSQTIKKKPK